MNDRTKMGLEIVQASLLLGILGDAMLRATPWGLNLVLWVVGVTVAAVALSTHWRPALIRRGDAWLYGALLLFSLAIAWRDSLPLQIFDILALITLFALLSLRATGLRLMRTSMSRYALSHLSSAADAFFGPFVLLIGDIKWANLPSNGWTKHLAAVLRGLLIVTPLLIVFGLLLTAADAIFAGIINKTLQINFSTIVGHVFLGGFLAWLAGGYLRGVLLGAKGEFAWKANTVADVVSRSAPLSLDLSQASVTVDHSDPPNAAKDKDGTDSVVGGESPIATPRLFSLGMIEVSLVLGLLNLLFLGFVIVQIRYLFGSASLVQATIGLSYADYARNGFFQLVTVALLVLPILLAIHWLLAENDARLNKLFRILAGVQVLLLFVIMASAVKRMMIYQNGYGLTELRLYTTAFMGWLALVFAWFSLTVLRGQRQRFVGGALIAGLVVLFGLHAINPDALIVRVNTAQGQSGKVIDASYLTTLSADATPELIDAMPAMTHADRCMVAGELMMHKTRPPTDWRSWNWSRSRAGRAMGAAGDMMQTFGCGPDGPAIPVGQGAPTVTVDPVR